MNICQTKVLPDWRLKIQNLSWAPRPLLQSFLRSCSIKVYLNPTYQLLWSLIQKLLRAHQCTSPWFQPGWRSCRCTRQPWTRPSRAEWPCPSGESSPPLASPLGEPPSWPYAGAWGETVACGAGHGSASSSGGRSTAASAAHCTFNMVTVKNEAIGVGHKARARVPLSSMTRLRFLDRTVWWTTYWNNRLSLRTNKIEYALDKLLLFKLTRTCPEAGPGPHLCRWTSWKYASFWSQHPPGRGNVFHVSTTRKTSARTFTCTRDDNVP